MTTPYKLPQQPDDLLRLYKGDLRAMAEAARAGYVDPTSAVMAGFQKKAAQETDAAGNLNTATIFDQVMLGAQQSREQEQAQQMAQAPQPQPQPQPQQQAQRGMPGVPMQNPGMFAGRASGGLVGYAGKGVSQVVGDGEERIAKEKYVSPYRTPKKSREDRSIWEDIFGENKLADIDEWTYEQMMAFKDYTKDKRPLLAQDTLATNPYMHGIESMPTGTASDIVNRTGDKQRDETPAGMESGETKGELSPEEFEAAMAEEFDTQRNKTPAGMETEMKKGLAQITPAEQEYPDRLAKSERELGYESWLEEQAGKQDFLGYMKGRGLAGVGARMMGNKSPGTGNAFRDLMGSFGSSVTEELPAADKESQYLRDRRDKARTGLYGVDKGDRTAEQSAIDKSYALDFGRDTQFGVAERQKDSPENKAFDAFMGKFGGDVVKAYTAQMKIKTDLALSRAGMQVGAKRDELMVEVVANAQELMADWVDSEAARTAKKAFKGDSKGWNKYIEAKLEAAINTTIRLVPSLRGSMGGNTVKVRDVNTEGKVAK